MTRKLRFDEPDEGTFIDGGIVLEGNTMSGANDANYVRRAQIAPAQTRPGKTLDCIPEVSLGANHSSEIVRALLSLCFTAGDTEKRKIQPHDL